MKSSMQTPILLKASSRRRSVIHVIWIAALEALLGSACLSPTLPLPPPSVTSIHASDMSAKTWAITGDCIEGALVTAFNETTGKGEVIEDRDLTGRFTITIEAS